MSVNVLVLQKMWAKLPLLNETTSWLGAKSYKLSKSSLLREMIFVHPFVQALALIQDKHAYSIND